MNKLESYLLKLVIPFIRIAHCPRGSYFKVKGDLILISSDIYHSLSKILPLQQSLIPVCFKRKLSYDGSYIEEYIEKVKVKMYFDWLKTHNHLYKNVDFDTTLVENFLAESNQASTDFENNTREDEEAHQSDNEQNNEDEETYQSGDEELPIHKETDNFEPQNSDNNDWTHDQATMFLNKYCENTNIPTVANRIADIIVEYEINKKIPF